eukprot:2320129-Rhodomonas_salina.2
MSPRENSELVFRPCGWVQVCVCLGGFVGGWVRCLWPQRQGGTLSALRRWDAWGQRLHASVERVTRLHIILNAGFCGSQNILTPHLVTRWRRP